MRCTSCNAGILEPAYLDSLFPCQTYSNCGGSLVMLNDYLSWQEKNQNNEFLVLSSTEIKAYETSEAMVCPKTGGLMSKYKISKDSDHHLDLSPTINAVWIDQGEWELLTEKGLASSLNTIFTDHWQSEIRS